MKLKTKKQREKFIQTIKELREETNHHEKIDYSDFEYLKGLWERAQNTKQAKKYIKNELGW